MVFKFTIDNVLNKYIPRNRLSRLPRPIARLLGAHKDKPAADYFIWLEILIGTFAGVALLEGVFKSPNIFRTDTMLNDTCFIWCFGNFMF